METGNKPAFPTQEVDNARSFTDQNFVVYKSTPGMSMREYFAAKAMQGILSCEKPPIGFTVAEFAVIMADALIAELDKK